MCVNLKAISFIFCICAVGCSSSYKAPNVSEKAYMRVSAVPYPGIRTTSVRAEHLSSTDCKKAERNIISFLNETYIIPSDPGNQHADLGIPGGENIIPKLKHEFEIEANKEFVFLLKRPLPGGPTPTAGTVVIAPYCVVAYSFVPELGAQYEASYMFNYTSCNMNLSKITKNESGFIKTKVDAKKLDCNF